MDTEFLVDLALAYSEDETYTYNYVELDDGEPIEKRHEIDPEIALEVFLGYCPMSKMSIIHETVEYGGEVEIEDNRWNAAADVVDEYPDAVSDYQDGQLNAQWFLHQEINERLDEGIDKGELEDILEKVTAEVEN